MFDTLPATFPADNVINVMSCRELAYQIAEQFRVLGKPLGLRDCIIVGGMGNYRQYITAGCFSFCTFNSLKVLGVSAAAAADTKSKHCCQFIQSDAVFLTDMVSQALELSNQPHVVVATPGRLADHIRSSNTFSMSKIQFLVSSGNCE